MTNQNTITHKTATISCKPSSLKCNVRASKQSLSLVAYSALSTVKESNVYSAISAK